MLGTRHGRWLVVGTVVVKGTNRFFPCKCDCGTEKLVSQANLTNGVSLSCGCFRKEFHSTHGKCYSRAYSIWGNMKRRCSAAPSGSDRYYGRGISVCERWETFENFLADMGDPPDGKTLDRIDNNKGYEPGNCRWATVVQQSRNTSRNVMLTHKGETMCLLDWATRIGISYVALKKRIRKWGLERALTTERKIA